MAFDPTQFGATPATPDGGGFDPSKFGATAVAQSQPAQPQSLSDKIWGGIAGVGNALGAVFPGAKAVGEELGTTAANIGLLAHGKNPNIPVNIPKLAGGIAESAALPVSLGAAAPASIAGAAAQYGGLGAISSAGESARKGNNATQVVEDAGKGGALGAALGGAFGLLGKAVGKVAAPVASVTSGVPKAAIEQAGINPTVTKQGVGMNVEEVRSKAVSSLQSLYNDLNKEHAQASSLLGDQPLPNASTISSNLIQKAQEAAQQFKIGLKPSADGMTADFSKSAIVNPGEENTVKKALETVNTWDDFSEKGLQTLNQRVNALKNYESGAATKSSAIVGKIHDAISQAIDKNASGLSSLNESYSVNKKVLDNISDVIGADAKDPVAVQSAVSRLDNIFKENRDEYVNIIRQLGERSGTDYLSLLAGGEFQKLLPGYIRSAVAVGSVGGIGSVASNPMSLLLLPLFSPRAVGAVARVAPKIADQSSKIVRAVSSQAIPPLVSH